MKARYGERDKSVIRSPGVGGRVSGYSDRDMNWRKRENTVVPKAYEPQAHNRRKEKSERVYGISCRLCGAVPTVSRTREWDRLVAASPSSRRRQPRWRNDAGAYTVPQMYRTPA